MKMSAPSTAARGGREDVNVATALSCPKNAALLIDDDGLLGRLLANALLSEGVEPHFSGDALSAFERWSGKSPDMLFAEIKIPGAWTFACHIKKGTPLVRVILLLDRRSDGIRKTLERAGIDSVIVKPVTTSAIRNAVACA